MEEWLVFSAYLIKNREEKQIIDELYSNMSEPFYLILSLVLLVLRMSLLQMYLKELLTHKNLLTRLALNYLVKWDHNGQNEVDLKR